MSLRDGSQMFACIMCFFVCILSGRVRAYNCYALYPLVYCVYVGGYCGMSESALCVFGRLSQLGFHVVWKCLSVLLQSVVMSYVDCGDDGQVIR